MRVLEGEPTRMGAEAREASLVLRRQESAQHPIADLAARAAGESRRSSS